MSELAVAVEPVTYEVTAYPFHDIDRDMFTIRVERRGQDSWAVLRRGACWNRRTKQFEYEPLPSSRTDAYKRTHRFPLNQALAIAREQAPLMVTNGWTVAAAIADVQSRDSAT